MGIKCIALDLDGTTLCSDKSISQATHRAICKAIRGGIQVVVASGRCLDALPQSVTGISGISYAITSNGAAIYDLETKECLRRLTLTGESVDKILEITKNVEVVYEAFWEGVPYGDKDYVADPLAHGAMPYAVNYIHTTRQPVDDIQAFLKEHKEELDGLDIITRDMGLKKKMWDIFQQELLEVYITSSVENRIEIANYKAGKHSGLKYILDKIKASPEEAAAFGDADNDIEMLSYVKYGMAVENASKRCKEAAYCIVPSNMDDGVALGIEKLLKEHSIN